MRDNTTCYSAILYVNLFSTAGRIAFLFSHVSFFFSRFENRQCFFFSPLSLYLHHVHILVAKVCSLFGDGDDVRQMNDNQDDQYKSAADPVKRPRHTD